MMRLTQLGAVSLALPDLSGLEQLPPHVTFLSLHTWEALDIAGAPCLQSCSSLQTLLLTAHKGMASHALAERTPSSCILPAVAACLVGFTFQVGHWPQLTNLIMIGNYDRLGSGKFRLQHWPPLEAEPLCLPNLAEVSFRVWSDAIGLLQLEHTILSLMLSTSASWHRCIDCFREFDGNTPRSFHAIRSETL